MEAHHAATAAAGPGHVAKGGARCRHGWIDPRSEELRSAPRVGEPCRSASPCQMPGSAVEPRSVRMVNGCSTSTPGRGTLVFARATITGELKRHLRDNTWGLHVPRGLQERYLELSGTREVLAHELGRLPATGELARRAAITGEEAAEALDLGEARRLASLDSHRPGGAPIDVGHDDRSLTRLEDQVLVRQLVAELAPRDRQIVRMRFWESSPKPRSADGSESVRWPFPGGRAASWIGCGSAPLPADAAGGCDGCVQPESRRPATDKTSAPNATYGIVTAAAFERLAGRQLSTGLAGWSAGAARCRQSPATKNSQSPSAPIPIR